MSWKIFFTRFQFACDLYDALNQDYNKSFDFYWLRDFYVILIFFFFFFYWTTDFENRQEHRFKTTAGPMKSPSIYIYMYIHIL